MELAVNKVLIEHCGDIALQARAIWSGQHPLICPGERISTFLLNGGGGAVQILTHSESSAPVLKQSALTSGASEGLSIYVALG